MKRKRIFRPEHTEPGPFRLNFILLPYGEYYKKAQDMLGAKRGDVLRIYGGEDYEIDSVFRITDARMCDTLCRMRYGTSWSVAYDIWKTYSRAEGYGKDALSKTECIMVVYGAKIAAKAGRGKDGSNTTV